MYDWPTPLLRFLMYMNKILKREEIYKTIDQFATKPITNTERKALIKAIKRDIYRHLITPDEFFLFDFLSKSEDEKKEFVGDIERSIILGRLYNSNQTAKIYASKMRTYDHFARFMKRDVIKVASEDDRGEFLRFIQKHDEFLIKPESGDGGHGIKKESSPTPERANAMFDAILALGACVLEELIIQSSIMASLHPQSVNTVRFTTYYDGQTVTAIQPFLKIGQGSCFVDNGAEGGILAVVDDQTGIVKSHGRTEDGRIHAIHPDTKIAIEGFQIPDWEELLVLVNQLVRVLPEHKYVGWDLAHSAKYGWIMVEGNAGGAFIGQQMPKPEGIGKLIESTLGRL